MKEYWTLSLNIFFLVCFHCNFNTVTTIRKKCCKYTAVAAWKHPIIICCSFAELLLSKWLSLNKISGSGLSAKTQRGRKYERMIWRRSDFDLPASTIDVLSGCDVLSLESLLKYTWVLTSWIKRFPCIFHSFILIISLCSLLKWSVDLLVVCLSHDVN